MNARTGYGRTPDLLRHVTVSDAKDAELSYISAHSYFEYLTN